MTPNFVALARVFGRKQDWEKSGGKSPESNRAGANKLASYALLALLIGVSAILFIVVCSPARDVAATSRPVTTNVEFRRLEKSLALEVRLKSNLDKPIYVYKDYLPWTSWESFILIAAKARLGGVVLDGPVPLGLPALIPVEFPANGEMTGTINLDKRYPTLRKALKETDVIIFWSYRLLTVDDGPLEREGGWILIPKGTK